MWLQDATLWVYHRLLIAPLKKLYFGGPLIYGYGFWGGKEQADMCSELTNVEAKFWLASPGREECSALLEKQFSAFLIAAETALYLWLVYRCLTFVIRWFLWKFKLAPESWRRSPQFRLGATPPISFYRQRSSPKPKRKKNTH